MKQKSLQVKGVSQKLKTLNIWGALGSSEHSYKGSPQDAQKSCPDCLRIQLTVVWLNFTMPNQTVKNDLKVKKI